MEGRRLTKTTAFKFTILCSLIFVAISISGYSQVAKPDFRVYISTLRGSCGNEEKTEDFKIGETIKIKVEITNLSDRIINIPKGLDYSRPILLRSGKLIPYVKEVRERERRNYKSLTGMLIPKPSETQFEILDLHDFYGALKAGRYQLSLERYFLNGNPMSSNKLNFKIASPPSRRSRTRSRPPRWST